MRKRSIVLLVGAAALIASLVVGPASAKQERQLAGTVVFIHDQEPPNLQDEWTGNNLYATSLVVNNIWYGCQIRNQTGALVPRLCESKPKIVKRRPLTIQLTYKKNAVWSDGTPVTAKDLRARWQAFINPKHNPISRTGWDQIQSVSGNGKTATIVFKTQYGDWETTVSDAPYPAHIISGKDMNQLFLNEIPVSSGPWRFQSWQKGVQLTVVRNPRYTAGAKMKLDRVVFRYILDTNARFQALKANEGQVMEPQPQLQLVDFLKDANFVVDRKIGFAWEHIDFQFGDKGHPALKKRFVREALITGINRPQIAQALYGAYYPGLKPAQSHMFKPFEPEYKENFKRYFFSQKKVIDILKKNGCTGGPDAPSASNSNIFSCPGVGKLSFRFFTTSGNQLRALTFEIIQRQLKSVGIELLPRFQVAGTLFGTTLPGRDWDLIMFTYVGTPSSPIISKDIWACNGPQNYMTYCNQKASALLNKVAVTLDPAERAKMINEAEGVHMAADIPSIPVFARPVFVIRKKTVNGPVVNPTNQGTPWNVDGWTTA
jgi:peptide/nickel transport system substrate-binding protein